MKNVFFLTALGLTAMTSTAFAGSEGIESEEAKASLTVEILPADATPECKANVQKALEDCGVKVAPQPKRPRTKATPRKAPPAAVAPAKPKCEPCEKLADLEKRVGKLEGSDEAQNQAIGALRLAIQKTREMIDGLPVDDDSDLQVQINQLFLRLESLEQHIGGRSIQVGVTAGVLALSSNDDTSYFGAVPAIRFVVPLGNDFSLSATLGLPLSFGNGSSPVGTYGAGAIGYEFAKNWTAEVGGAYTGFDYNSQLDAKMAFITGLAGVKFDITKNLDAGLQFHIGREHDQGDPAFAFGGFGGITLHTNK